MLSRIEELKLVARCALSDDREAFGQLVEEYQSEIRRFFINLSGGDIALSDDLAQETFIKAYISIRSFKGLSRFRTWLYRIAYNEFYDWSRKRKEELGDDDSPVPPGKELTGDYERSSDARMDIQEAMKALSETERTVVVLFYMEDKPIRDISAITQMPEGTIKSHLSRAKSKLAEFLGS